jgi:hypothetical protein
MTNIEKLQNALRLLDKNATVSRHFMNKDAAYIKVFGNLECGFILNLAKEWRHAVQHYWNVRCDKGVLDGFDAPRFCYEQKVFFDFLDLLKDGT